MCDLVSILKLKQGTTSMRRRFLCKRINFENRTKATIKVP